MISENFLKRIALFLFTAGALLTFFNTLESGILWDLEIYSAAAKKHANGGNAYLDIEGLKFVYPPVILQLFALQEAYLKQYLIAIYCISLVLLLTQRMKPLTWGLIIYCSATILTDNEFIVSVLTGNVTVFFHIAIIYAWFIGLEKKAFNIFWVLVFLASCFKPYYLGYAIVPFVSMDSKRSYAYAFIIVITLTLFIWAYQYYCLPDKFEDFLVSLKTQIFQGNSASHLGDLGVGFYRYFVFLTGNPTFSLVSHFALIAVFSILYRFLRKSNRLFFATPYSNSLIALSIAIIANPRLKVYDSTVLCALTIAWLIYYTPQNLKTLRNYCALILAAGYFLVFSIGKLYHLDQRNMFEFLLTTIEVYAPIGLLLFVLVAAVRKSDKSMALSD